MNALNPGLGVAKWATKKLTGIDLDEAARDILLEFTEPIREQALSFGIGVLGSTPLTIVIIYLFLAISSSLD